ncbi:MAG: hypothetical protein Q7U76_12040 [Nitrospirota bacterium]|nr:hypothetical protein [Nitrospirota bacterium]
MNLQGLAQQYRGTTLPKLVESQIKSLNEDALVHAIRGTYEHFPTEFRLQVDAFTLAYPGINWAGPHIAKTDLGDIFSDAIQAIKDMATQAGVSLNDEQVFDVFNLIVMRVSYFANSNPDFRKSLGIKKDWFS